MFFLEGLEEVLETQETTELIPDETGLMEAALHAEMEWNNIMMEAVQAEAMALRSESVDMEILTESVKSWFDSVIKWFQQRYAELKQFVAKVWNKIEEFFDLGAKYVEKHKDVLNSYNGETFKTSVYTWKTDLGQAATNYLSRGIKKYTPSTTDKKSADDVCKVIFSVSLKDLGKKIADDFRTGERSEKTIDAAQIKKSASIVSGARSAKKAFKAAFNESGKTIQEGIKEANKGKKGASESEVKGIRNKVNGFKSLYSVQNKVQSNCLSLYKECVRESLGICKKAVAKSKSGSKNESYSLFV